MRMFDAIRKYRRDRWVAQVVANGDKLRRFQASRASVDARLHPHDAAYLDSGIDRLTRRRDALLTKIKETA
jgi:hypothetical protein